VGKSAVKTSRLERQLRQQAQETDRQKQRDNTLTSQNEQLHLDMGEMQEKLKAMEAVMSQHMQMKDSLEKLEAPPPVLQQRLGEEREKVDALQSQVGQLVASSRALDATTDDLKKYEAFINDYCQITNKTFRLVKETAPVTGKHISAIRDILRRIKNDEDRIPTRLAARIEQNLDFREISARQQGLMFSKDDKIAKIRSAATSDSITDRSMEISERSSIHEREPSMLVTAANIQHEDTAGKICDEIAIEDRAIGRPLTTDGNLDDHHDK
jgi:predicted RNase H-like nuclease (RuvC/YqgF family)